MAALYADEDLPLLLVHELQTRGHDVLTAFDDGRANQQIPDFEILNRATALLRAVVTRNGWDFHRLHRQSQNHAGIITTTEDDDISAIADRIHTAIAGRADLAGLLIRITKP